MPGRYATRRHSEIAAVHLILLFPCAADSCNGEVLPCVDEGYLLVFRALPLTECDGGLCTMVEERRGEEKTPGAALCELSVISPTAGRGCARAAKL